MPRRRQDFGHPHSEDRGRDRARETRARSRVRRRRRWDTVKTDLADGVMGAQQMAEWKMDETVGAGNARVARPTEPLTEELLDELLSSSSPAAFAAARGITHRALDAYLNELLAAKGLKRSEVVRAAGINETFGYQIFKGQRNPSRDKVLQLAFAMRCSLIETNRLLQAAGVNELYCKDRRDAIILFCIDRGLSLQETDEELYRFGETTLGS